MRGGPIFCDVVNLCESWSYSFIFLRSQYFLYFKDPGVIRINKLQVSPSPLPSPGIFYVTMEEETLAPLNSSKVELSVKKLGLINIPVPCITKFGSWWVHLCVHLSYNWKFFFRLIKRNKLYNLTFWILKNLLYLEKNNLTNFDLRYILGDKLNLNISYCSVISVAFYFYSSSTFQQFKYYGGCHSGILNASVVF